jgi:molybdopterin converting factor small subunit
MDAPAPAPDQKVTVRLFAAARAAASGLAVLEAAPDRLDAIVAGLVAAHPPRFAEVLGISTLVCDGVRLDPADGSVVPAGSIIDVLPPFAGG